MKPCRECPFRRKSLAGYLGNNELEDWEMLQEDADPCIGRATMWKNTCKMPIPNSPVPNIPERDVVNVFANIREFRQHHEKGIQEQS